MTDLPRLRRIFAVLARLSLALMTLLLLSAGPASAAVAPHRLPLISIPAATATGPLVVFYSGDGGWAHTDRILTQRLAAHGLSVVGVDTLHYFWSHKTPDGAAADLAEVIRRYGGAQPQGGVILAGYSFGANALPLIAPRLPPEVLARVKLMVLIAPGDHGELVLRPNSWINRPGKGAALIGPALASSQTDVLCVYGARDHRAACPRLGGEVTALRLPGGHHLNGQEDVIAQAIADTAQSR